jgi:hypothetical protein
MRLIWRALSRWLGIGGLMTTVAASPGLAAAATANPAGNRQACTGTVSAAGTLAGTYSNLVITGTCVADAGPVNVTGNLTVAAGGALTTSFGLDDQTGTVVRNTSIRGNVVENGGGAGTGCVPAAISNQYSGLPEYSDYTSKTIDGNPRHQRARQLLDGRIPRHCPGQHAGHRQHGCARRHQDRGQHRLRQARRVRAQRDPARPLAGLGRSVAAGHGHFPARLGEAALRFR